MSKFDGSEDDWVSDWSGDNRGSKYQDSFATQAEHIYRLGATDAEAAEFFITEGHANSAISIFWPSGFGLPTLPLLLLGFKL